MHYTKKLAGPFIPKSHSARTVSEPLTKHAAYSYVSWFYAVVGVYVLVYFVFFALEALFLQFLNLWHLIIAWWAIGGLLFPIVQPILLYLQSRLTLQPVSRSQTFTHTNLLTARDNMLALIMSLVGYFSVGTLLTVFLADNTPGCCDSVTFALADFPALQQLLAINTAITFLMLYPFTRAFWSNRK